MGIIGMLIFVPLTSVVYALVREYVVKTLRDRHIPREKYDTLSEQAVPQREYKRKKIKNKNKKEG
jgi:hypothetical protein